MLHFIFGEVLQNTVFYRDEKTASGYLELQRARVRWFLSIDSSNLPDNAIVGEKLTYRSIKIGDEELEFSGGFTDLHTQSYKKIIEGDGYGIEENRTAIEIVEQINTSELVTPSDNAHALLSKMLGD